MYKSCLLTDPWQYIVCDSLWNNVLRGHSTAWYIIQATVQVVRISTPTMNTESCNSMYTLSQVPPHSAIDRYTVPWGFNCS